MRILLTADTAGGVWTYAAELSHALAGRGHDVTLVALGGPGIGASAAASPRVEVVHVRASLEWEPDPEAGLRSSLAAIRRLVGDRRPDVVHLNQYAFAAHELGAPALVAGHSDVVTWWHEVRGSAPPDEPWLRRYRARVAAGWRAAAARVAPTRWLAGRLLEVYGGTPAVVIPNGRSASGDAPRPGDGGRRVVAAGRLWDEGKGIADLVAAAGRLPCAEVLLAGPRRHPVHGAIAPLPGGVVRYLGVLDEAGMRSLLRSAAVYAATSRYEPFGLAPLEAALAGCALVCSDIPTFRELWDGCALFYEAGDAAALGAALAALLGDPALRGRLAARAQARARSRYGATRMAAAYETLYRGVAAAGAATRVPA
jgi:glycogen synthase